jgi:hypothetical protein
MARPMIFALALLAVAVTASACQSTGERLAAAARAQGELNARPPEVIAPEACIAHMERVVPKLGEKARWTQKRWEIVADNRDRQADDCGQWIEDIFAARGAQ